MKKKPSQEPSDGQKLAIFVLSLIPVGGVLMMITDFSPPPWFIEWFVKSYLLICLLIITYEILMNLFGFKGPIERNQETTDSPPE